MLDFSDPQPTRIERGNYLADVLRGSSACPFWYYVIQRKDPKGIIDLVKFNTYEQAFAEARQALEELNGAAKTSG